MIKKTLLISSLFICVQLFGAEISDNGYALYLLGNKNISSARGWSNHASSTQLLNWGNSKNIVLIDDMAPVANQRASFIPASGVSLSLSGMKPHITYTIWIDFVKYKWKKNPDIYSKLHVYVDGRQVDEIVWGKVPSDTLYKIEMPLDLTYDGEAVVSFREYAMNYGYWGVWDIIVASGDLPEGSYFEDELMKAESEAMVEMKTPEVKKESSTKKVKPEVKKKKKSSSSIKKKKPKKSTKKKSSKTKQNKSKKPSAPKSNSWDVTEPKAPSGPSVPSVTDPVIDQPKIPDQPSAD